MTDNTMTLVGNLVDDPELRFTPAGQPVARPGCIDAEVPGQQDGGVEGRRVPVPHLPGMAPGR